MTYNAKHWKKIYRNKYITNCLFKDALGIRTAVLIKNNYESI